MKNRLTPIAKKLRTAMGPAETKLWLALRDRRLSGVKFRRQVPVGPYVADFAAKELKLILEVDGGQHAELRKGADDERTAYLVEQGYQVIRFWNNEVLKNIEGVLQVISDTVASPPSPGAKRRPLPGGERESRDT